MAKKTPNAKNVAEENESEFFGTAKVGIKGQIVIPKVARDKFDIRTGDSVLIFGSEGGILAMIKADKISEFLKNLGGKLTE